jgi:hypothetical protein
MYFKPAWCEEMTSYLTPNLVSTTDAVFILHSLIQKCINDNNRLYCSFIDLKHCFDSIYRNVFLVEALQKWVEWENVTYHTKYVPASNSLVIVILIILILLLFADDMVILGLTPQDLQTL